MHIAMATLPSPPHSAAFRGAALIAIGCGVAAALVILGLIGSLAIAAAFLAAALVVTGGLIAFRRLFPPSAATALEPDWSVARALAESSPDAIAVTDRAGRLVCANDRYEAVFSGFPTPPGLPFDATGVERLGNAGRAAWRDGGAAIDRLLINGTNLSAQVSRAGEDENLLVWRFHAAQGLDLAQTMENLIAGATGDRLGSAGIMAALIKPDGRIRAANRVLRARDGT